MNFPWRYVPAVLALFLVTGTVRVNADVRLPAILSAHALLQKSPATAIWGWADPAEAVTVTLGSQKAEAVADAKGRWVVRLDLSSVGPGPFELTVSGRNKLVVTDVLVGDVWLSSGQSNMQYTLNATTKGGEEIARSANNQLRWFMAENSDQFLELQKDVPGHWVIASPGTSGDCSGVAYYFGKKLQADLKIPVGLILTAVGGTTIQSWMSDHALDQDEALKAQKAHDLAAEKKDPAMTSTFSYNQLIAPLESLSLRGVIWYQGEAHFNQGALYRKAFPLLIRDWRRLWQQPGLPFLWCQLPNLDKKTPDPGMEGWVADLRDAQSSALAEPHTGEVILIDVGAVDLHPKNKEIVGMRLANLAEASTYGRTVPTDNPRLDSAKIEGRQVVIHFKGCPGGLGPHDLPARTKPNLAGSPVQGFALCGADHRWVWAQASIEGDSVQVESPQVAEPVEVRYAWSNNPTCNLYNRDGLPAVPFQVDLKK